MRRMRRALANPPPNDPLEGVLDVRASLNERKPKIRKRLNLRRPGSEYVNEITLQQHVNDEGNKVPVLRFYKDGDSVPLDETERGKLGLDKITFRVALSKTEKPYGDDGIGFARDYRKQQHKATRECKADFVWWTVTPDFPSEFRDGAGRVSLPKISVRATLAYRGTQRVDPKHGRY